MTLSILSIWADWDPENISEEDRAEPVQARLLMQGSKLTFLLGSTGAPNFKKLGAP